MKTLSRAIGNSRKRVDDLDLILLLAILTLCSSPLFPGR